jgi:hypothetical protein
VPGRVEGPAVAFVFVFHTSSKTQKECPIHFSRRSDRNRWETPNPTRPGAPHLASEMGESKLTTLAAPPSRRFSFRRQGGRPRTSTLHTPGSERAWPVGRGFIPDSPRPFPISSKSISAAKPRPASLTQAMITTSRLLGANQADFLEARFGGLTDAQPAVYTLMGLLQLCRPSMNWIRFPVPATVTDQMSA